MKCMYNTYVAYILLCKSKQQYRVVLSELLAEIQPHSNAKDTDALCITQDTYLVKLLVTRVLLLTVTGYSRCRRAATAATAACGRSQSSLGVMVHSNGRGKTAGYKKAMPPRCNLSHRSNSR